MPDPILFFGFILTAITIELTPGPNMGYLAILSVSEGRRAGFAATIGIAIGLLTIGIFSALGLTAMIEASPLLYQILRWGGMFYLFWLAWEGWQRHTETSPGKTHNIVEDMRFFRRGLITNLLNPKAALFYVAVLPGYTDPLHSIMPQTLTLTLSYVALATIIHCSIVILAGTAQIFLSNPNRELIIRRVSSVLLALIAVWFFIGTAT